MKRWMKWLAFAGTLALPTLALAAPSDGGCCCPVCCHGTST
jgi:hypothetical protein